MGGSTKVIDTTSKALKPLRNGAVDYLMGNPSGAGGASGGATRVGPFGVPALDGMFNKINGAGVPSGGPQPAGPSPYDRINAGTVTANAPTTVPYGGNAIPVTFNPASPISDPNRDSVRDVGTQGANDLFSMIMSRMNGGAPGMQATAGRTDSVDTLGSASSPFFQNMMANYAPAFQQSRIDNIVAAKEGAGNLTGSGAGNALGKAAGRSMGQEQALLAELAKWGVGQEMQRQQSQAGLETNASIANAGNDVSRIGQLFSTALGASGQQLQGAQANQQADLSFLDQLLGVNKANQGVQQQTNMAQGNADLSQALQNQQLFQNTLNQSSAQGVQNSQFNAGQTNATNNQNAANFLQMLMGVLGNNNVAVQQNPGVLGSVLSAAAPVAGAFLGGPGGAALGKKLFG